MEQQIREQIAHLQRESRFLRNLAGGILFYSIVTSGFLKVQFLSPLGFLFAVFLYLSARDIYKGNQIGKVVITFPPKAETLQERYHLFLQTNRAKSRRQIREESVWKLHTRLILLLTFYVIDMISYPTIVLAVNMAVTLALCALYEWGLRRFEKRTGI